jgi:cytochrome-b5 reductase
MEFVANNIAIAGAAVAVVAASAYIYAKSYVNKSSSKPQEGEKVVSTVFQGKQEVLFYPKLIEKETLTQGACPVKRFRFELEHPNQSLGLPVGQHISITFDKNGVEVTRKYTPVSTNDDLGYFELVVKIYPKGEMSQHLDQLKIGDKIKVSGPYGRFLYEKNKYAKIGMIAGGTGITPMLQVIKEILKYDDDRTEVSLIFGNVTELDIILREMIEDLATKHPRFKVFHVLNEPPEGWTQGVGFVTKQMIVDHLPEKGDNMNILMCGPPPMTNGMTKILKEELGFERKHYFVF